jgi:hypothetical protein
MPESDSKVSRFEILEHDDAFLTTLMNYNYWHLIDIRIIDVIERTGGCINLKQVFLEPSNVLSKDFFGYFDFVHCLSNSSIKSTNSPWRLRGAITVYLSLLIITRSSTPSVAIKFSDIITQPEESNPTCSPIIAILGLFVIAQPFSFNGFYTRTFSLFFRTLCTVQQYAVVSMGDFETLRNYYT